MPRADLDPWGPRASADPRRGDGLLRRVLTEKPRDLGLPRTAANHDHRGRDLNNLYPDHEPKIGEEMMRVEGWTVMHPTVPGRIVSDNASFDVKRGEIVGIAGLMGAGRTELAMSLFGQAYGRKTAGKLFIHGKEVDLKSVDDAIEAGLAYATEDRKRYGLNLIDDIRRNISAASLGKIASRGVVNSNEEIKVAEHYRKALRIKTPTVMTVVGQLSGGNQQKVVLAKWFHADGDLLIFDEPTRGVDVGAKTEIYSLIKSLAAEGRAILVISSEHIELFGLCDRILVMREGELTGSLAPEDYTEEKLLKLAMVNAAAQADAKGSIRNAHGPAHPGGPQHSRPRNALRPAKRRRKASAGTPGIPRHARPVPACCGCGRGARPQREHRGFLGRTGLCELNKPRKGE